MSTQPLTVLVAHGDPRVREHLRATLSAHDWNVLEAQDGPAIVQAYRDRSPRLVLVASDVADGGANVCRTLRLLPGNEHVALVALVPAGQVEGIAELIEAGADDVCEVPCPEQLLVHRLRRALRDPVRGKPAGAEGATAPGDWMEALSQDVEALGEGSLAVISLSLGLIPRPGGREPGPGALESLAAGTPARIERALEALRGASGGQDLADLRIHPQGEARFLLVAPRLERIQDAAKLASALQDELGGVHGFEGEEFLGIVNIGIASSPNDGREASELVRRAETACYCSRQEGGSNAQFYAESMSRWAFERLTLERSLREAVDRDEMEVYYQPRVSIGDRKVVGFEALVRWNHPQLGLVSPGQFIPLAEETGMIVPIGEWVLRTACQQARDWQDRGFEPVRVSVNLSAAQFRHERLDEVVQGILEETGLEPGWLELEVTESMLMTDAEATVRTLQDLKRMGVHLSIDDFGTGYSSLSYLKRFPIDALKIDRSFVRDVTTNPDDAAIATSIILMGHSLRLSVVAEGVEEERQLSFLQVLQCNEAQGFLFSPPVPAHRAESFLRRAQAA